MENTWYHTERKSFLRWQHLILALASRKTWTTVELVRGFRWEFWFFRSGDEPARLLEGVNFSQTSHASTTESESSRTMSGQVFGWLGGDQDFLRIVKLNCSKQWLNIWASFQQPIIRPLLTLLRGLWYPQTDGIIYRLKAAGENKSSYFLFQANKLKQKKKKTKMQNCLVLVEGRTRLQWNWSSQCISHTLCMCK